MNCLYISLWCHIIEKEEGKQRDGGGTSPVFQPSLRLSAAVTAVSRRGSRAGHRQEMADKALTELHACTRARGKWPSIREMLRHVSTMGGVTRSELLRAGCQPPRRLVVLRPRQLPDCCQRRGFCHRDLTSPRIHLRQSSSSNLPTSLSHGDNRATQSNEIRHLGSTRGRVPNYCPICTDGGDRLTLRSIAAEAGDPRRRRHRQPSAAPCCCGPSTLPRPSD